MSESNNQTLDLIAIGRAGVDLYGSQIGGRLEDMASFEKYIGGSPTNIAAGTARLGLKSGLITRVGDEHMGRFIREQLEREGVDTSSVITDPDRLTALVLLGIRDREQFPLIFVRENCADMALCEDDIDADFIGRSRCLVATGTHLSHPVTEAAVMKALKIGRENKLRLALDIDYRPNLWGLAGHDAGESRFIASDGVTRQLQKSLPLFDLIVGTEEEFHIAGGSTDTMEALRAVRKISNATLVCKRGPMGAAAFIGEIPDSLDDGIHGPGFPIEVFNVLGAGDGFMSGLLKGWLDGETMEIALTYANACGALAVSRHGCTPAYPSWTELEFFLERGVRNPALRHDHELEQVHWSTNRRNRWPDLRIFAFDHRMQLEQMADEAGETHARIGRFKQLCLQVVTRVADGRPGYGLLCDHRLGSDALYASAGQGLWTGRPTELPGSRPLQFEPELGVDLGRLREWPLDQIVKVLCFYHPDDDAEVKAEQEASVMRLFTAARRNNLEFLLEIVSSREGAVDDATTADVIRRFYDIGVYPDWWKLEPLKTAAAWQITCDAINANDPHVQGVVVLGLDAPVDELEASFRLAAAQPMVKGFAVGRTIFSDTARAWLRKDIDDNGAIVQMTDKYSELCRIWDSCRNEAGDIAR